MSKIYALLVGINEYTPDIGKLRGCVNDVDRIDEYLRSSYQANQLSTVILKDADATRKNIIEQFRGHLGRAGKDDVALFQFAGHGARWASAEPFKSFFPDGKDEGLVCYDSRHNGEYDLADKELAVLLSELGEKKPHIAVILDCCHSGSGTRSADDLTQGRPRQTHEVFEQRPLGSYLDGYYEKLLNENRVLEVPSAQHVVMAACRPREKAWESKNHSGVFTDTLLEVLEQSGGDISYADLFVRCRLAVRSRVDNQNPQFDSFQYFNSNSGFLGGEVAKRPSRYSVHFESPAWKVDCGALHGLPTDVQSRTALALYTDSEPSQIAGHASTSSVGASSSKLSLDFKADPNAHYAAEIVSLPIVPTPIYVGGQSKPAVLQSAMDDSIAAVLVDVEKGARYAIENRNDQFTLHDKEKNLLIQGVQGSDRNAARHILSVAKHVLTWERRLALRNQSTQLDSSKINFWLAEPTDGDNEIVHETNAVNLCYNGEKVPVRLYCSNASEHSFNVILLYFGSDYSVRAVCNEELPANTESMRVLENRAGIPEGDNESIDRFKLLVTTERVDQFLLSQDKLKLGVIHGATRSFDWDDEDEPDRDKLSVENEWLSKDLTIRTLRQSNKVDQQDASLSNDTLIIKGHPSVKANISLSSVKSGTRSAGADILAILEHGTGSDGQKSVFESVNLSVTRGDALNVLELSDIQNASALQEQPLEIELDIPLSDDEHILPLTFEGEYVLLGGDAHKSDSGKTIVKISELPKTQGSQRSLGGALKLYFFKTYLKSDNVNKLRWVEYLSDGAVKQRSDGVAEKVAAATRVAVLVHGIIGDTKGMAQGLQLAKESSGTTLRDQFDLVLTFDYENLSTPIEETALDLRQKLNAAGLNADDDKHLTLLVHSMGGLVSRWLIEKLGGNAFVDHLVMCGTPNGGSPFGKIDTARAIVTTLATIAINALPVAAPFCAVPLMLLNRSKKLTPCLEQMNAASSFITQLNDGQTDPGVRYTILAGNIEEFEEHSDAFVSGLIDKVGKGGMMEALFDTTAHDIAVSQLSIRDVPGSRTPEPAKVNVACHHLNYFDSDAGIDALLSVDW